MIGPGIYEHYKGTQYEVVGVGYHSETGEALVYYRKVDDPTECWIRPLSMFEEIVEDDIPRFKFLRSTTNAWEEFRENGLLWLVNRQLQPFGVAIVATYDTDGNLKSVHPRESDTLGFDPKTEEVAHAKFLAFLRRRASE